VDEECDTLRYSTWGEGREEGQDKGSLNCDAVATGASAKS
jgi:hypothetical protein